MDLVSQMNPRPPAGVRVGTAGWADPALIKCGRFYPRKSATAADRLQFYADNFNLVEVDSSYYAIPAVSTTLSWAERTPDDFLFNVKAYGALTQHPINSRTLSPSIRHLLPDAGVEKQLKPTDLPPNVMDRIWVEFRESLEPLVQAGKLGAVLFQFPKWFLCSQANMDYILRCRERMDPIPLAAEFRQSTWLDKAHCERTLGFLRDNAIVNVVVDEPQGHPNSVPLIAEVTAPLSILRLHGHRSETWNKPGISVQERFKYLYSDRELHDIATVVRDLKGSSKETHVVFNNCYEDFGVKNAQTTVDLLVEQS